LVFADLLHGNMTLVNNCILKGQVPLFSVKPSETQLVDGVPMVINHANTWLDLHPIYHTNSTQAPYLRTHVGGKLLTQDFHGKTTNPLRTFGLIDFGFSNIAPFDCIDCPPSFALVNGAVSVPPLINPDLPQGFPIARDGVFVSGDERVNENAALTMFHLLFIRNHNRHAGEIASANPTWNDEQVFQAARRINIAEYQNIVMYQYIPSEFGQHFANKIGDYDAYDPYLDADTNVVFSSAAFRYGHSSFRNYVPIDACAAPTMFNLPAGNNKLVFGGQTGGPIITMDVMGEIGTFENLIRGLISQNTAPNDHMIDSALRDLPFTFPFAGGTDILALDLFRARQNGIPNYFALQKEYGQFSDRIYGTPGCPEFLQRQPDVPDPLACFARLAGSNSTLSQGLKDLYGKVIRIDPLIGLLIEKKVPGTSFGETLGSIIMDTYKRTRDADRFWFENPAQPKPFTRREVENIKKISMGDLLYANFHFPARAQVPDNPFLVPRNYARVLARTCNGDDDRREVEDLAE